MTGDSVALTVNTKHYTSFLSVDSGKAFDSLVNSRSWETTEATWRREGDVASGSDITNAHMSEWSNHPGRHVEEAPTPHMESTHTGRLKTKWREKYPLSAGYPNSIQSNPGAPEAPGQSLEQLPPGPKPQELTGLDRLAAVLVTRFGDGLLHSVNVSIL